MKQKDKELLLKDLTARLPFEVKAHAENVDLNGTISGLSLNSVFLLELHDWWNIEFIKPYLRPMSSMTEEECNKFFRIVEDMSRCGERGYSYVLSIKQQDWLNKYHFDYHGLIPKGLALEAPEDMYKTE